MRRPSTQIILASLATTLACMSASAQVAGSTTIGVQVEQLQLVATGWSLKKQVLGKTVVNENGEKVGRIDDLIVAPDSSLSFAIVGAGGFVGLARHDVAIPVSQISARDGNFVLPGASKAVVKAMPAFEYAK
jgi:sporulation protein YlmC with PRC-barrel domain